MRRVLALLSLTVALAAVATVPGAGPASAHASVSSTEPKADADLTELPRRVVVRVVKKQATRAGDPLQVFAPDGTRVDTGDVLVGDGGATISVGVRAGTNAAGTYNVLYQITSADTHIIEDRFAFTLTPSGTGVLAPPNPSDRGNGNAQVPAGRLRLTGPPAGSVLGVALLLVALVLLVVMARRRRRHVAPGPEHPGFRVVTSGEHRLGPIPSAPVAEPRPGPERRWEDDAAYRPQPARDGRQPQWAPARGRAPAHAHAPAHGHRPPPARPGRAPARPGAQQWPANGTVPAGSHARNVT